MQILRFGPAPDRTAASECGAAHVSHWRHHAPHGKIAPSPYVLAQPFPLEHDHPSVTITEPVLPARIGKYRVLKRLGEGATSEVFLARDDFHERDVAIKRLRNDSLVDAQEGHYFERFFAAEAALVGRLHHPNVVQIYDAVADPAEPYLVMEYVGGVTLRRYCRPDQLLSLELIVEIGFKCAMALGYVYRQGLIHRDIKPANLLVVRDRGNIITDVKVTDFGSVLNLQADTTQIFRVGSLAYMSPEQLDGGTLDARADIYSLGAVMYHLIAGRPPFDARSQAALMHQICNDVPPSLADLRSGVSPALDAVIATALAKRPQDRHADWDTFGAALSALVAGNEVPRGQLQGVLDSERFSLLTQRSISSRASATSSCGRSCTAQSGSACRTVMRCSSAATRGARSTSSRRAKSKCFAPRVRSPSSAPARRSERWSIWRRAWSCATTAPIASSRRRRRRSRSRRKRWASSVSARGTCSTRRSSVCWCGACTRRTKRWPIRGASCSRARRSRGRLCARYQRTAPSRSAVCVKRA